MSRKINIDNAFWKLVLLFPVTTLVQKYLAAINQLLFALTFAMLLYLVFHSFRIRREAFFILCVVVLNHAYALANTVFPVRNSNTLYYFSFWVLYYILLTDKLDNLKKFIVTERKYICNIIMMCCIMIFISMLLPSSYSSGYFESFTGNSARTCPVAVFVLTLILVAVKIYGKRKMFYLSVFPMYCFFMGDSRTYLGVGLMLWLIVLYYFLNNRKRFYISLLPTVLCVVIVLFSSSVMSRFTGALDYSSNDLNKYYDFWGVLTSGRSVFWVDMLSAYWRTDWIHRILGCGFHFVYTVRNFWAHNDFVQLLLTFGFTGLLTYLWTIRGLFKTILVHREGYPRFIIWLMVLIWLVNCFFNMFYVYMCALLSFPFMLVAVDSKAVNNV